MDWTRKLDGVNTLTGSVTEAVAWSAEPLLKGLRGIFHLAALVRHSRRDSGEVYRTNVEGTLGMVRLAATHRCRMIFVSTSGTVGRFRSPDDSAAEEAPYCDDEVARWPYYRSKILAEKRARRLAEELGVELVILRPPVLLGPGDHSFRSTSHLLRYLRGKLPFVIRGGLHFADVRDAAGGFIRAMTRPQVRPVYHLPGTVCSVREFFALAEEVSGAPAPRLVLPFWCAWWLTTLVERLGVAVKGKPLHLLPDPVVIEMASRHWNVWSRYAGEDLDYCSRAGRETLTDTIAWMRENDPVLAPRPSRNHAV